ncbi:MAG: glutamine synthetase III [Oscillospiraceae bacterium]|nr:glutamine synthetase III [Oscillospiraceae bacterium]
MNIPELFGCMVFGDAEMQARLPAEVYDAIKQGSRLSSAMANIVAAAMKDWALAHGVTHYTHWFQPMTGVTAEKHDSFIEPVADGEIIMKFSGKALVCGEPDASSLPSGGLRCTFEARGYTAWDPTAYAFIKDETLCIPTAFCGYNGESLDKKTPLLRSMQAINKQALRVLRLFGNENVTRVDATVGAEQEYFLIDKAMYLQRPDLIHTGRTLLGAPPPKGQELEDHYFGAIKPRVSAFMKELDLELWKLGVPSKTRHNETAPAQHELAPVFTTVNIATDHNQLVMELAKSIAERHHLACLLHEKPFAGVNGSGKHNNWSLSTSNGQNLFEPGDTPHENAQFLLFLTAVIKAVDDYQDLLRASAASAGNDHRLGAHEAPPAIISLFLGNELTDILKAIELGEDYHAPGRARLKIGVSSLPRIPKDSTDRNRTSPMAFTGNKFEFRMLGSAFSIAGPNFVLNTIVAEVLRQFADELEQAADFTAALDMLIQRTIKAHKRILFNGNNYAPEWVLEAKLRGLSNLPDTPSALQAMLAPQSVEVFARHAVLNESELHARHEILMQSYRKTVHIEALTMLMLMKDAVIPACVAYQDQLTSLVKRKREIGLFDGMELQLLQKISTLCDELPSKIDALEREKSLPAMATLRQTCDALEALIPQELWPLPSYAQLLNSVV